MSDTPHNASLWVLGALAALVGGIAFGFVVALFSAIAFVSNGPLVYVPLAFALLTGVVFWKARHARWAVAGSMGLTIGAALIWVALPYGISV